MLLLRYSYSYFFFLTIPRPPTPTRTATLFPTRRSADLPRPLSAPAGQIRISGETLDRAARAILAKVPKGYGMTMEEARTYAMEAVGQAGVDRKSTRLNSSQYCAERMPSAAR